MKSAAVPDNYLLELLDMDARVALCLVPVELHAGDVLYQPTALVECVYFPVSAVISLVSTMKSGASAEVALIGREGMAGLAGMLGTVESPTTAVVQIPGLALKTTTAALRTARLRSVPVRTVLDRYTEARLIQTAQTAACNGLHSVEARLARWLLAIDDRIDSERFRLPQELMAHMLGIQRPTVSVTMHRFQELKAIAYDGRSIIVNRARLERLACECYGVLRREFERLRRPVGGTDLSSLPTAMDSAHGHRESAVSLETMRQIAGRLLLASIREQEAREDAEAANRAKDQFLAMASHELRTPLNAILGWCAILTRPGRESVDHGLQVIQQNAKAQLTLVEDLLDAVRLASSTLAIHPAVVHLGDVVQDAVDTARPMADEKQVVLRLAIVDELSPLIADADRLRQVFLNVVMNALKFTDAGGAIDVSVAAAGRAAHVTVRDTGRGIAPGLLPHVFERFRRGRSPADGSQGLGLGLTIAQALIELHGGRIQLASAGEGLGTTCTIDLPIRTDTSRSSRRNNDTQDGRP
jgi:signal transduction histidine kinase